MSELAAACPTKLAGQFRSDLNLSRGAQAARAGRPNSTQLNSTQSNSTRPLDFSSPSARARAPRKYLTWAAAFVGRRRLARLLFQLAARKLGGSKHNWRSLSPNWRAASAGRQFPSGFIEPPPPVVWAGALGPPRFSWTGRRRRRRKFYNFLIIIMRSPRLACSRSRDSLGARQRQLAARAVRLINSAAVAALAAKTGSA